ncbi:MAG: hypothetical protein IH907_02555 [Proteobacteria bacterium]|nr:hypothetical protein [Pseudomonadota bacterium]
MIFDFFTLATKSMKIVAVFVVYSFLCACTEDRVSAVFQSGQGIDQYALSTKGPVEQIKEGEKLHFVVQEGKIYNEFYRQGSVAAHMLLTSGLKPRLIVAFPAGNSGVSLWFKQQDELVEWQSVENMTGVRQYNANGEPLFGIQVEITVTASQLVLEKAVLGSIRTIRNYMHGAKVPGVVESNFSIGNNNVTWSRSRLDQRGGYKLSVEVIDGEVISNGASAITFKAIEDKKLRLRIVALTGDEPLTPIGSNEFLNHEAAPDLLSRQILSFLSYQEKMLAGSWRFLTYFGRDTLLSLRMLMPVLKSEAIEAGLGSVIERLDKNGEVAHEEDIGEYAILRHMQENGEAIDSPIFDYKMIDDDYMLPTIAAHYFLDQSPSRVRTDAFLSRKTPQGQTYGAALVNNMNFVLKMAEPFVKAPIATNLVGIKDGMQVGEWRDSNEGLGGGKYAFNVNAVFVPAALQAIASLKKSGVLDSYMAEDAIFSQAESSAQIWQEKAPAFFRVSYSATEARNKITAYAARLGVPADPALSSLTGEGVGFYAVSLDKNGKTIPVIHSDIGFMMLFDKPTGDEIEYALQGIMRPFPGGLMTPVGLVVANSVYASEDLQRIFSNGHYHGSVIWSWQQALLAAGLERQLARDDLSDATRQLIAHYQNDLWQVIKEGQKNKTSELWSWAIVDNEFTISPFGQGQGHTTESNAAQLWSTVYLAIHPPGYSMDAGD